MYFPYGTSELYQCYCDYMYPYVANVPVPYVTLRVTSKPLIRDGTSCPGTISMTCIARDVPVLRLWANVSNGSEIQVALHDGSNNSKSLRLTSSLSEVTLLTTGYREPNTDLLFEVNLTISSTVSYLVEQNITSMQCGTGATRSDIVNITAKVRGELQLYCILVSLIICNHFYVPASPPSLFPSNAYCFLTKSGVSLQWLLSFTRRHSVDYYHITVNADPSSLPPSSLCPTDQSVSPSENYSCSGLALNTLYSFDISAVNCRDNEGTRYTFSVLPKGMCCIFLDIDLKGGRNQNSHK